MDYQRYLASRPWALLREAVRRRSRGMCERCAVLPMAAVHHLTYANVGNERLEELQAICASCHEWESGRATIDPLHVTDWVFNSSHDEQEMEPVWGEGWKRRAESRWAEVYGMEWEAAFIRFAIEHPEVRICLP